MRVGDRILGALSNFGYRVSDQTIGNILKRHGYRPGPEAQPGYNLEGIHSVTHGGFGWS